MVGVVACSAPRVSLEPVDPRVDWMPARLRSNLTQLSGAQFLGRRTSTVGLSSAAEFVAGRLASFQLQPVHPGQYRHVAYAPINHVSGVLVRALRPDSAVWVTDRSMLPDPRSASVRRVVTGYRYLADATRLPRAEPGYMAVVDSGLTTAGLEAVAMAGYNPIFSIQTPGPGRSSQRLSAGIVSATPIRTAEILGVALSALTSARTRGEFEGPVRLRVTIEGDFDSGAPMVNTLAYLPGADPMRRSELVVVLVELDSGGFPAGVPIVDGNRTPLEAAALLEAARKLSAERDYGIRLRRTVLFGWLSGGAQDHAGYKALMAFPPWSSEGISALILAGVPPDEARKLPFGSQLQPLIARSDLADPVERAMELAVQIRDAIVRAAGTLSEDDSAQKRKPPGLEIGPSR